MSEESFDLGQRRRQRRMSLTPMIDVVFLLLIFFMLSSRFGMDTVLPVAGGTEGGGSEWIGAPRLVDISPDRIAVNGVETAEVDLARTLAQLMPDAGAAVILRPQNEADLQRLVEVMDMLRGQGLANIILVE